MTKKAVPKKKTRVVVKPTYRPDDYDIPIIIADAQAPAEPPQLKDVPLPQAAPKRTLLQRFLDWF
jgi:hypothetical protein